MLKKLFILLILAGIVGVALYPIISKRKAEEAFNNPSKANPQKIKEAIMLQKDFQNYKGAGNLSEKAVIYLPESKQIPFFVYNAALCAEKEGNAQAAIYWYGIFIKRFPKHDWFNQASHQLEVLKGLHGN
jgi:hypothetical protein